MPEELSAHRARLLAHAREIIDAERGDRMPLELKLEHTFMVLANAQDIIAGEALAQDTACGAWLGALYHDLGRFSQYARFHTFRDRDSCNHGLLGVKQLKRGAFLAAEEAPVRRLALLAVGLHNRYALPAGLAPRESCVARVVRDADKLDILRIMDAHLSGPGDYNPTVVLSLPDTDEFHSPRVIEAALAGRTAAYADLRTVNDFRLLLASWFFDLSFDSSRRRLARDGHARRLLAGLPPVGPHARAAETLLRRLEAEESRWR